MKEVAVDCPLNIHGNMFKEEIEQIMLKETWFTAEEYKNKGFVDEII